MHASERVVEAGTAQDGAEVHLRFGDGATARYHAIWLRDNAPGPDTRDPVSGQRLLTVLALPEDPRVLSAEAVEGGLMLRFAAPRYHARYAGAWLRAHRYDHRQDPRRGDPPAWVRLWDASHADLLARTHFDELRESPRALADWLRAARRHGFALIHGVPARPGALEGVVALFGHIRETNYGRLFDVRAQARPENLAYTALGLQVHTDNPYRDPVPTLQLLHCLANEAAGGESVVVDGYNAALRLREEAPADFALLANHPVPFEYGGASGVRLSAREPMIRLAADGELRGVRFNNRSAGAFDLPFGTMAPYYAAYRRLARQLEDPTLAVTFRLAPGDLFIVDNERVLHGRRPCTGSGLRHLQGCYADRDGLNSRLAVLEADPAARAAA